MDALKDCGRREPRTTLNRTNESREKIRASLDIAYGTYIEKEKTQGDSWRALAEEDLHEKLIDHLVAMQDAKDKQQKLRAALDCILDLAEITTTLHEALDMEGYEYYRMRTSLLEARKQQVGGGDHARAIQPD